MKNIILKYSLIFLTLLIAFFSWQSVERSINVPEASIWIPPIIWFSCLLIILSLDALLIKDYKWLAGTLLASFSLSAVFTLEQWHIIPIVISCMIIAGALVKIRKDSRSYLKISLSRLISANRYLIVAGLALAIAGQYYFTIKDSEVEKVLPKFEMSKATNLLAVNILSIINPDFKKFGQEGLTVDQFILENAEDSMIRLDPQGSGLDKNTAEAVKNSPVYQNFIQHGQEEILKEGRRRLSQSLEMELTGREKIAEIFPEIINKKINNYFSPLRGNSQLPVFPAIMAILLFLTVLSLGSLVSILIIPVSALIFALMIHFGAVNLVKVPAEKEIIE